MAGEVLLSTQAAERYSDPDRRNETTAEEEERSKEVVIGVDLFTVVVSFAVLLTLSSVGTVSNVMVLAVIKYRKSFRAALRRDAALANLSLVHLILCCVLSPIEFATLAENYVKHSLPGFLCLARDCGFHLLVGANVIGVVILAARQARRLQRACAATRATDWAEGLPVLQLALPWMVGACAAALTVAIRLVTGLGFEVCRKSTAFWEEVHRGVDPWQLELLPVLVYFLLLSAALLSILVVVQRNRSHGDAAAVGKSADRIRKESETADDSRGQRTKAQEDVIGGKKSPEAAKGRDGDGGGGEKGEGDGGGGGGKSERIGHQKRTEGEEQETDDGDEDDDDTFDVKMRHEFEKKSRSSGRRHTVANIGLPDLSDLRSREMAAQPPYASKTAEYHYVRKWSVDITALANQLENPKSHSDTSPFKERETLQGYHEEETAFKALRAPSNSCVAVTSCQNLRIPKAKTACGDSRDGTRKEESVELRSFQKVFSDRTEHENREIERKEREERPSPSKTSGANPSGEAEGVEGSSEGGQRRRGLVNDDREKYHRDPVEDEKVRREMITSSRLSVILIVSLVLTLPCVVIFLWLVFAPQGGNLLHIGYNLSIVAEIVVTLQAALNPLLLFWVDRRLQRRLRNLVRDMAHLRCVCYCNIGRQGNCLQPNKGPTTTTASYRQAPVDGNQLQKV